MTLTTGDWNVPPPTLLGQGVPRVTTELPSLSGDAPLRLLRTMMVWIGSVWFGLFGLVGECAVSLQNCSGCQVLVRFLD